MDLWNKYETDTTQRDIHFTRDAQEIYRPVGLKEQDLGLQYGNPETIAAGFVQERDKLAGLILEAMMSEAEQANTVKSWNAYGVTAAKLRQYEPAVLAFGSAARIGQDSIGPRVNLGSVKYLQRDFNGALSAFKDAEEILLANDRSQSKVYTVVLLNISKSLHALERFPEARNYYQKVEKISPEQTEKFAYLAKEGEPGGVRASDAGDVSDILFIEGEE